MYDSKKDVHNNYGIIYCNAEYICVIYLNNEFK